MQFTLSHTIAGSPAQIYPYFADAQAFGRVHPIIYKVEKKSETEFEVYEKVRLLWIFPYRFSYRFVVESATENKEVFAVGYPQKGLIIKMRVVLTATENGKTKIDEYIEIIGSWLPTKITKYFLVKSHFALVKIIEQELRIEN